jgi:hypothetical protein
MMIFPVRSSGPVSYGYSELENNNEVSDIYFVFHLKSSNVHLYYIEFTWIFSIKRFVYNREMGILVGMVHRGRLGFESRH